MKDSIKLTKKNAKQLTEIGEIVSIGIHWTLDDLEYALVEWEKQGKVSIPTLKKYVKALRKDTDKARKVRTKVFSLLGM